MQLTTMATYIKHIDMSKHSRRRGALAVLLLFLLSSCSCKDDAWSLSTLRTCGGAFDAGQLVCSPEDAHRGIELEITRNTSGTRVYLNSLLRCIRPFQGDSDLSMVWIENSQHQHRFLADRLAGGQRLVMGPEASQLIIDSLREGECIALSISGHKQCIDPAGFSSLWAQLACLDVCFDPPSEEDGV